MPILSQDIIIKESDTMTDAPEGGGAITGNTVVDGQSNNIFEDISTLDRVYGAVHMRKVFPSVYTQDTEPFLGSHAILSKLPGDEKIGVNLFTTDDWFDRRDAAQFRVENYRTKGGAYLGFLLGTQYQGSKVITIFQGMDKPLPGVGEVLYLTQNNDTESQYIRIYKIEASEQDFYENDTPYTRRVLNIEITQPLEYDFVGVAVSRSDNLAPAAQILTTVIPNAARYYSTRPLVENAVPGDLFVKTDSIYSQIVPSSTSESAITDADANGYDTTLTESANGSVSFTTAENISAGSRLFLGRPCEPGSLVISGDVTFTDSAGDILAGTTTVGAINYATGELLFSATAPTYSGTKTVTFKPSAAPVSITDTAMLIVEDTNRGYVWTYTITPAPRPGTVRLSYMTLGNWYTLKDNHNGVLKGIDGDIGVGSIDYTTGTLSVTLNSLPDIDSAIMISWGHKARYYNRANITPEPLIIKHQLQHSGIAPATLVISWDDGQARSLTANDQGVLSGDGSGTLSHTKGTLEFKPSSLPLGGAAFTIDYQFGAPKTITFNNPLLNASDQLVLDIGETNLVPNTVGLQWDVDVTIDPAAVGAGYSGSGKRTFTAEDNGSGALGGATGTVDYAGGIITFKPNKSASLPVPIRQWVNTGQLVRKYIGATLTNRFLPVQALRITGFTEQTKTLPFPQDGSGTVIVGYRTADSETAAQEQLVLDIVTLELQNGFAEDIIPGSVHFKVGSKSYIDRNGLLYTDINPLNGSGVYAGTIDYSSGIAQLTSWPSGVANSVTLQSMATVIGRQTTSSIQFRVPVSPVKPQSLQIRVVPVVGGAQIEAVSDASGFIVGSNFDGWIDYATGVVSLQFGEWVAAAGNEAEAWYDADFIVDSEIFKPIEVYADTLRYNAVTQSFLPLDASILGLDPVRLPQDGRIPIYAKGDVLVVMHDQITSGTFTSGQTVDLGRTRLSKITVRDLAGNPVDATKFTVDLDAGTITIVDVTGLSQPLSIIDRIEDMAVCTDVQITGRLTLSQPITHDFPADETLVASAVIFGDMFARTSVPFDQQTWTGAWSDALIGNATGTAQYNHIQHPIQVDNASTIQERWAIILSSATTCRVIGENLGEIIQTATVGSEIAPVNPNTGQPYFTLPAAGWGTGWSTGNVIRFNTYAANAPLWIIQSVAQGEKTSDDLDFTLEYRGDVDTP